MQRSGADSTSSWWSTQLLAHALWRLLEQAPQVRVLRLQSQVACRPLGASVFDAHTFALPVVKGNAP